MFATEPVGGLSFLNTKFKEFPAANISFPNPNGPGLIIGTGDAVGNRLLLAQKFAGTLTAEYTTRVSFGELKFSVTENHTGSYFFDPDNVTKERAYDMINVSDSWTSLDESITAELYARNALRDKFPAPETRPGGTQCAIS